jgi:hypothetical protein
MLYSKVVPSGEVNTIVPVGFAQIGCVIDPNGAKGLAGIGLTKTAVAVEIQRVTTSRTLMLKVVFGANPAKVALDWYEVPPLMLYSKLAPVGDETTIVPVVVIQSG